MRTAANLIMRTAANLIKMVQAVQETKLCVFAGWLRPTVPDFIADRIADSFAENN